MTLRSALAAMSAVAVLTSNLHAQLADEQSRRSALGYYRTGMELLLAERFEQAAGEFLKAIEKDRLLSEAHYELAQAYMNLRRYASAVKAYVDCLAAMQTLHDLRQTNQFEVERQRDDQIHEMRVAINQVKMSPLKRTEFEVRLRDLEDQPSTIGGPFRAPAEVLFALGSAFFRNNQRDEAEAEWKAALEANPKMGKAHNNLAVIYMETGRLDLAEDEIKLAEKNGMHVNPQFKEDLKKAKERK
jgi:tetratricopeptide (TPR) repeat protein